MSDTDYKKDFEDIQEEEIEPLQFWEEKQRELVTSVVDYNLGTLSDLIHNKDIDLAPKYQRRFRWDEARQSKLIESFLMNVPVPPIFLNEDAYGQYSVIDGKQRLSTIYKFLRGRLVLQELEVFADINGFNFDNLPGRLQTVLRTRVILRAVIVLRQSDPDIKFEVFQRLNTGGVRLNAQEIRNSVYPGPFNDMILELSEHRRFHKLLGIKPKDKENSALYQEMRDVEFVLRYFTFRGNWGDFSGGIKRNLDIYMQESYRLQELHLKEMQNDFLHTLDVVEACFGDYAFQRWVPEKRQWRQQILASLYDAQMFACREFSTDQVRDHRPEIIQGLQHLFTDADFRQAIDAATNAPSFFKRRITKVKEMINSIVDG